MIKRYSIGLLPGLDEWLKTTGLVFENDVNTSVPFSDLQPGDCVYGTFSIYTAAKICATGARAFLLEYTVPEDRLLGAIDWKTEIYNFNPRFVEFYVEIK